MPEPELILSVDVGGSHVKALMRGWNEPRRFESGPRLTAAAMVDGVRELATGSDYDVVSVGVPAPVVHGRVVTDPFNLGKGWAGFDFAAAFEKPTKVLNDAAMQALGSYEGGTMVFLGLGTGLGTAVVVAGVVEPLELGHMPFRKRTFEDYLGQRGLDRLGKKRWREAVNEVVELMNVALEPDSIVLGGGNAKKLDRLPEKARLGSNLNAFEGGFRLWQEDAPAIPV